MNEINKLGKSQFSDSNPYSSVALNFWMEFNIIAPYMEMLHINRSLHQWFPKYQNVNLIYAGVLAVLKWHWLCSVVILYLHVYQPDPNLVAKSAYHGAKAIKYIFIALSFQEICIDASNGTIEYNSDSEKFMGLHSAMLLSERLWHHTILHDGWI